MGSQPYGNCASTLPVSSVGPNLLTLDSIPLPQKKSHFVQNVLDLLAGQDGIAARSMFGGHGIYRHGVMFGLIAYDVFYLKVDDENRPDFEQAGSSPFQYTGKKDGKPIQMSYWEAPPSAMERSAVMEQWAERAQAAAARGKIKKPSKKKASKKKTPAKKTASKKATAKKKPAKRKTGKKATRTSNGTSVARMTVPRQTR